MHRFMDGSCSNCNKFSHCCNNDLICISKYKEKEQECEELKQWKRDAENLFRTQTDNADKIINRYKQALKEIEKLIPKFDSSSECDYGDFDCENCSSLDEEIVCGYKLKKIIKGIINKVKEENQCEQ